MSTHRTRSKRPKTAPSGDTSSVSTSPQPSTSPTPSPASVVTLPETKPTPTQPASSTSPKQRRTASALSLSTSKSKVGNPFGNTAAPSKLKRKKLTPAPTLIDDYKRYVKTHACARFTHAAHPTRTSRATACERHCTQRAKQVQRLLATKHTRVGATQQTAARQSSSTRRQKEPALIRTWHRWRQLYNFNCTSNENTHLS